MTDERRPTHVEQSLCMLTTLSADNSVEFPTEYSGKLSLLPSAGQERVALYGSLNDCPLELT